MDTHLTPATRTETPTVRRRPLTVLHLTADDLPCPWCGEPTDEADTSCVGCGGRFG